MILLSKKDKNDNGWSDFTKRCNDKFSPTFKFQLAYNRLNFKTAKILKSKIKKIKTKVDLKKIVEIYKTRESVHNSKDWASAFISAMDLGFDIKNDKLKHFEQNEEILTAIKKERKSFLAGILQIIVAVRSENQAWAKKVIREFLNIGPAEMIFYHQLGEYQDQRQMISLFQKFLNIVNNFVIDIKWKKMFFNQIAFLSSSAELPFDLGKWNANWSFQEVQKNYKSPNYGPPYLGFWYEMYYKNTFPAQVDRFMAEQLTTENIKKWGRNYFWLFSYYFPEDEKAQNEALKIIYELNNSKEMYHKFLVLHLLEKLYEEKNYKVINKIKKAFPEFSRPLFQIQRKFYNDLLKGGEVLDFSIYQLLKLKDKDIEDEMLWYVTF